MVNEYSIAGVIHLVLLVWALWDLFTSGRSGCGIGCWIVGIIFFPVFGPIIYLLFGRSSRG